MLCVAVASRNTLKYDDVYSQSGATNTTVYCGGIQSDLTGQLFIRYDTRCYINVCSKANMSQLNLPHGVLMY